MSNYDLSVCLPGHRTHLWERLYNSIQSSIGPYSWELIMVGPNEPPPFFSDKDNFKFLKDYGSPARCFQISTLLAEGRLITWGSDDGYYTPGGLENCVQKFDRLGEKDIVIVKHAEGVNHTGKCQHPDFWRAWHHPPLRLSGIPEDFYIILNGMLHTSYYRQLGGMDCKYENYNMNLHDFAFRAQRCGTKMHFSDIDPVLNCDWNPNQGDHTPVAEAHTQHDMPLFVEEFSKDQSNRKTIDLFNCFDQPTRWIRRFGEKK